MMARREAIRFWRAVSAGAWFAVALAGANFSVASNAYAAIPGAFVEAATNAQSTQTLAVPADSPRWDLQGQAKAAEYQGRKCLRLDGGAAILNDFEMRDGVIDVDVATPATRGFFGFQFRIANEGATAEEVYLRQHKSGLPDAMQYTPILNTGRNWQLYNGPGFTGAVDIPKDAWFHLRLEVTGAQAKLYVKDMEKPALEMNDLKSGVQKGQVALYVLAGETYYSNFEIRTTPDAPWERRLPQTPPGTLTRWGLSPAYDALARNLERPLSPSESSAIKWQGVEAEPPGFVVINRFRDSPHPRVTFANDFSKRLEPQPGMKVVYARATIDCDREQVKKLYIGYSDDVSVFLNGKILFRGRSAQNFRDPGFLGIVNPENDAVYLPLKKGRNELTLAVSELGGGWGFICRLADVER
jgi:NADH:ubiquinone oxidoreductase subunit